MPPCSKGSWRRRVGPVLTAILALLATASLGGALPGTTGTAGASSPAGLSLADQTPWVTGPSGVELALRVHSALPVSRLGLNVVLYSRLGSRDALRETYSGTEPSTEYPLDTPGTIPLGALGHGGLVRLHLPVTTGYHPGASRPDAPSLALDCASGGVCAGIYPLELVVIDRTDGAPLASLTTYLVYAPPATGSLPLEVALVLPLGDRPALSPAGTSAIGRPRLNRLAGLLRQLGQAPESPVSLATHGQLVDALATGNGAARGVLGQLAQLLGTGHDELLPEPYASPSVDSLASTGLATQLARQLGADRQAVGDHLHLRSTPGPFVVTGRLDPAGLDLLGKDGVSSIVLPPTDLSTPVAPVATPTAPLLVARRPTAPSRSTPAAGVVPAGTSEVVLSDPGLAATFDAASSDPVLAAERFLAEAASVYFDDPYATEPRGVVVVPQVADLESRFLSRVLAGLASSPVLRPVTLGRLVDTVPVGANGTAATGTLAAGRASGGSRSSERSVVRGAGRALATLRSVVPTDHLLATQLQRAILVGESAGLPRRDQAAYEDAPAAALRRIAKDLSLSEAHTTLTSRSGRIPVTVTSSLAYPVHVLLRLRSGDLTFTANRSVMELPLDLTGKAVQRDIRVSARTSGSSRLELSLLSPDNGQVLVEEAVAIRSTAISGAAVALSIGALLVLLVWWVRSGRRRRRERRARPGVPGSTGAGDGAAAVTGSNPSDVATSSRP